MPELKKCQVGRRRGWVSKTLKGKSKRGDQLNIRGGPGDRVKTTFQVVYLDNWVDDSSFPKSENTRGTDLSRVNNECLFVCGG